MRRIFAGCTSYAAAERLSERTTSRELLAVLAEMLLEASVCAVVPLNLLAMLLCCPIAVQVLLGRTTQQERPADQHVGSYCTPTNVKVSQSHARNVKATTKASQQVSAASTEAIYRGTECTQQRPESSRINGRVLNSRCAQSNTSHGPLQQSTSNGRESQSSSVSESARSSSAPEREGSDGGGGALPPECHGIAEKVPAEVKGVKELGHALCGILRTLRSNILQPEAVPLLEALGAIAGEPGGARWLLQCGASLRVVVDILLQSACCSTEQQYKNDLLVVRGSVAEVRLPCCCLQLACPCLQCTEGRMSHGCCCAVQSDFCMVPIRCL